MEVTADDATMKQHQLWREMWESETCRPFTTREIAFAEKVAAAEREACAKVCDNMPKHVDKGNAVIESSAGACARAIRGRKRNMSSTP